MTCFPRRLPECWATGGDPLTEAQMVALKRVARHDDIEIPFLECPYGNGQLYTKVEAWNLIAMILDGVKPPESYLNSLGRNRSTREPPPSHSTLWEHCHNEAEDIQILWLECLVAKMGIPDYIAERGIMGLTYGQAAWLIGRLREDVVHRAPQLRTELFKDAVIEARRQVYNPDDDEEFDFYFEFEEFGEEWEATGSGDEEC